MGGCVVLVLGPTVYGWACCAGASSASMVLACCAGAGSLCMIGCAVPLLAPTALVCHGVLVFGWLACPGVLCWCRVPLHGWAYCFDARLHSLRPCVVPVFDP